MRGSTPVLSSAFEATLRSYNPLRWYPLDDYVSGGPMHDLGSQGVNGTYDASNFSVAPGLAPGRSSCIGLLSPTGPGASFSSVGLPTGASPWTIGALTYIWVRTGGQLIGFNQCDIDWGTGGFEVGGTSGACIYNNGNLLYGPYLMASTYDGVTVKIFIYACVSGQNAGSIVGSASLSFTYAQTTANGFVSKAAGDFYTQHAFICGAALTQTQIATLAQNAYKMQ